MLKYKLTITIKYKSIKTLSSIIININYTLILSVGTSTKHCNKPPMKPATNPFSTEGASLGFKLGFIFFLIFNLIIV